MGITCNCNNCKKIDVIQLFGSNVFNEKTMQERLPKETYKSLKETLDNGTPLKPEIADVVANAMKEWAIEKGATHYTHLFQPLTNITAGKYESFIAPTANGNIIMEFSGKQLIQGEPDASSFPSGGLRATFEARGYTAWDCTSPAFLKTDSVGNITLCIPTAFCSYNGQALDKKTPLLRSMAAINQQAMRVLRALGNTTSRNTITTVGAEQEYFLIDKKYYLTRMDLIHCNRTLFGAAPPKGQELEDQYFGTIKDRVSAFMKDIDLALWKMGVLAKTKHNEAAPAQFEIVPIFSTANVATDHNQLIMETLQQIALRHDLVCLLHEKPFAGVNGSGKHNNWSIATNDGINLLEPGNTPHENEQFLAFCAAIIQAVDRHADLLRAACATAGNDHRLGANEAPPAIISIFLGEILTDIFFKIAKGEKITVGDKNFVKVGVDTLPALPKDNSDRNRTSPFAFTGSKFEFRMVGASASVAGPNIILNTIVAEALDELATRLEKSKNVSTAITQYVKETINQHGRIIFNGNGYAKEWAEEAKKRGLPNVNNAVDSLAAYLTPKAKQLFTKYAVLSNEELDARYEIYVEQYAKKINIEANAASQMARRQFIPAGLTFIKELVAIEKHSATAKELLVKVIGLVDAISINATKLETAAVQAKSISDATKQAEAYRDYVFVLIKSIRDDVDTLEMIMPQNLWPVPTYSDMLFKL